MNDKKFDLCVVGGAGHVGLPFSLVFADIGQKVVVYDINQNAIESLKHGVVPFMENGAETLLKKHLTSGSLTLSNDPKVVSQSQNVVITVGTPVDEFLNPVFKEILSCLEKLFPFIRNDQLIILRSTVFPGTTDWVARWLKTKGKSPLIAFCPERVVEGKAIEEILHLPQIISGTTPDAEESAANFFKKIKVEIVRLTPMETEFAKLFTNAYRYINFAITNQFYEIANSANLDYDRILKGVMFHYPRMEGLVSAGFAAGPCLFKDTMQLNAFAKNEFGLGQAAMNINEGLVLYIIDRLALKYNLSNTTIGLLGMSFKSANDDIRSSLSYKLKKSLLFKAKEVLTTDPYVTVDPNLLPLDEVLSKSDIIILCAPHPDYKDLKFDKPIIDIWGFFGNGSLV
jgi:UDP-N-acetyl-D-mannosaminuronic acid dehydrogenase